MLRLLLRSYRQKVCMVLKECLKKFLCVKTTIKRGNLLTIIALVAAFSGLFVSLLSLYIFLTCAKGKLVISVPPKFEVYLEGVLEYFQATENGEYVQELPPGIYDLKIIRSGFVSFDGPVLVNGGKYIRIDFPFTHVNKFTLTHIDEAVCAYVVGFDYKTKMASIGCPSVEELVEKTVRGSKLKQDKYFVYEPVIIDVTRDLYASKYPQTFLSSSAFEDKCPPIYQWPDGVYSASISCSFPNSIEEDEWSTSCPEQITITLEKKNDSVSSIGVASIK